MRTRLFSLRSVIVLWVFVLFTSPYTLAETRKSSRTEGSQVYSFPRASAKVEVRLGQVEVFVVDKENKKPVRGLKPEDFQVFLDGKPVDVKYVDEIELEQPKPPLPETGVKREGALIKPYQTVGATPPELQFHTFIILYDASHTGPLTFRTIKKDLKKAILSLKRINTRFMVAVFDDMGNFKVTLPPTSNIPSTLDALDALGSGTRGKSWLMSRLEEIRRNFETLDKCAVIDVPHVREECIRGAIRLAREQARHYGLEEQKSARNLAQSLQRVFDFLSHVPGRKSVLLISEGFDPTGNFFLAYTIQLLRFYTNEYNLPPRIEFEYIRYLQMDMQERATEVQSYQDIIDAANKASLVIYWINPNQLDAFFGAEGDFRPSVMADFNMTDFQIQMQGIAEDTGGVSWNRPSGFEKLFNQIEQDFTHYYLISFDPGRFPEKLTKHTIEVKVQRKGVQVRFRKHFMDIPWSEKITRQLAAIIDFPELYVNPDFPDLVIPIWKNSQDVDLRFSVALPVHFLSPLAVSEDTFFDEIHVAWILRDEEGNPVDRGHERVPVQIPLQNLGKLEKARSAIQYSKVIPVKSNIARVDIAVLETGGWKTKSVQWNRPVRHVKTCFDVLSFFLASQAKLVEKTVNQVQWLPDASLQYKNYVVKFSPYRIFPDHGQLVGFYQISTKGITTRDMQVRFRLYMENGQLLSEVPPTSFTLREPTQDVYTQFFVLPYHNLSSGEYFLEVEVRSLTANCTAKKQIKFRVVQSGQDVSDPRDRSGR